MRVPRFKPTDMQAILELIPLLLFVITNVLVDFYTAIAVLTAALAVQVVIHRIVKGEIPKIPLFVLAITAVSGGTAWFFQDELFFQWKPTIVYWCFSLALIVMSLGDREPPLKRMMGKQIIVPDSIWVKAGKAAAIFFVLCGLLNLAVAYNVDRDTWVNFKVFGMTGITLVATIALIAWMSPHMKEPEADALDHEKEEGK